MGKEDQNLRVSGQIEQRKGSLDSSRGLGVAAEERFAKGSKIKVLFHSQHFPPSLILGENGF